MDNSSHKKIFIEAESISKQYGKISVLKDITLKIYEGEGIAFVGENGCGKSTLLRILAGLTNATKGHCQYTNHLKYSYIPDHFEKLPMTFEEYIGHMMKMEGIDDQIHRKLLMEYYEGFAVNAMIKTKMKDLSKGTLQKAAVIQAMLGESDVIFMDEPLSGQDANSQQFFLEQMQKFKKNHTTLIMACHEKQIISALADEVYQIQNGSLVEGQSYIQEKLEDTNQ